MRVFNQKGLTLIEVLVSILILAGGCVYVLQALAKSAEVQKKVEDGVVLYPFLASKFSQVEMRVSAEKNPFKNQQGDYTEGGSRYQWNLASSFRNPLEAQAPPESLGQSVLLDRTLSLGAANQKLENRIKLTTLTLAPIPENQK